MDYNKLAKEILLDYPINEPEIQFIRHNENITYKITDGDKKNYLLRIHRPVIEGLFGAQHTQEGIQAEVRILKELEAKNLLQVQVPIANSLGEYITKYELDNYNHPCYATVLTWIEGETLTLEDDNIEELAYKLGQNLALFHKSLEGLKPSNNLIRPIYDVKRIDSAIEELQYCVDVDLFSVEHYEIIIKVLQTVKKQIDELDLRDNAFGLIHADIQLGNIVVSNDNPCIIDLGFCGFGYHVFDLGSAATILPANLRKVFLQGYAAKSSFTFEDIRYIEGQIFMDIFISYALFMRDSQSNSWIKDSALDICDTLCKDFLDGKEVFYSL